MNDIDNILDATLDDLADAPSIQLWPNGAHKATIEFKVDKPKSSVQLHMTYVEPLELADPTSTPPSAGDKNVVFFSLKKKDGTANEYAQGALKGILTPLSATFGGASMTEVMENAKGAEVAVVTKIRLSKDPKYQDSLDVQKVETI